MRVCKHIKYLNQNEQSKNLFEEYKLYKQVLKIKLEKWKTEACPIAKIKKLKTSTLKKKRCALSYK